MIITIQKHTQHKHTNKFIAIRVRSKQKRWLRMLWNRLAIASATKKNQRHFFMKMFSRLFAIMPTNQTKLEQRTKAFKYFFPRQRHNILYKNPKESSRKPINIQINTRSHSHIQYNTKMAERWKKKKKKSAKSFLRGLVHSIFSETFETLCVTSNEIRKTRLVSFHSS